MHTVPADQVAHIREIVQEVGQRKAARRIPLAHATMMRVLNGKPVHSGTIALVDFFVRGLAPSRAPAA